MSSFPSVAFAKDYVKVRWLEPSVAEGTNQRHLGMPRGVYVGFTPSVTPGSLILTLQKSPTQNFSLLKVGSTNARLNVDLFIDTDLLLDFTGHTVWPVYVLATANYTDGKATNARVFSRATTASGPNEIVVCQVNKPAADLVVATVVPTTRQPPLAFAGQRFGFMGDNAIAELASASLTAAEVVAARTSVYTGAHPSLSARIADDADAGSMADRLGLWMSNLLSNAYSAIGSSCNVSGSFAATSRVFEPAMTIEAGGTESVEGAITGPTDPVRNLCFVIDDTSGSRLVDTINPSMTQPSLDPVYGRLVYASGTIGGGLQINWTQAGISVTGSGTNPFAGPFQQGDIVQGPDLLFYEVRTVIDQDNAVLATAYQGVTASSLNAAYRRFTLNFFSPAGVYSIPSARTVRFACPAFFRLDRPIFDGLSYVKRDGEPPDVPSASVPVSGKVRLAAAGALVGSIYQVRDSGVVAVTNPHTLNFTFGGATNLFGGVAGVNVIGPTGLPGANSNPGPDGNAGPPGIGYSTRRPFEKSPNQVVSGFWTFDFATGAPALSSIAMLSGGFARVDQLSSGVAQITGISKSGTVGRIDFVLSGGANAKFFLGASE